MTRFNKAASVKKFNISVTKKEKVTSVDKRVFDKLEESGRKEFKKLVEKEPIFLIKDKYEAFIDRIVDDYESAYSDEDRMTGLDVSDSYERFCDDHAPGLDAQTFEFCCGVQEAGMSDLDECTNAIMIAVTVLNQLERVPGAAVVFTDNNTKKRVHGYLSTIVAPISLGKNPNSRKNLYMWVVTHTRCKDFLKNVSEITSHEEVFEQKDF